MRAGTPTPRHCVSYVPGQYSDSEASRIRVLLARTDAQAAAEQIFSIYLSCIRDPQSSAYWERRDSYVDSLLELASFLGGSRVRKLLPCDGDPLLAVEALRILPHRRVLSVKGCDDPRLKSRLSELVEEHGYHVRFT